MTQSSLASGLTSEFNGFLFAPVCQDRNEMPLSVLSALARLDIDPWQEAAALAQLPEQTAVQRLSSLFARLPGWTSTAPDSETVAARLVALLPVHASSKIQRHNTSSSIGATVDPKFIFLLYLAVMLCLMWANSLGLIRPPPPKAPAAPAPGAATQPIQARTPADGAQVWPQRRGSP